MVRSCLWRKDDPKTWRKWNVENMFFRICESLCSLLFSMRNRFHTMNKQPSLCQRCRCTFRLPTCTNTKPTKSSSSDFAECLECQNALRLRVRLRIRLKVSESQIVLWSKGQAMYLFIHAAESEDFGLCVAKQHETTKVHGCSFNFPIFPIFPWCFLLFSSFSSISLWSWRSPWCCSHNPQPKSTKINGHSCHSAVPPFHPWKNTFSCCHPMLSRLFTSPVHISRPSLSNIAQGQLTAYKLGHKKKMQRSKKTRQKRTA